MQDYLIREGLVLVPGADDGRDASAGVSRSTATHATGSGAAATATPASATTAAHPQQQQPQQPPQQENANTAGTAGSGQDMGAKPLRKRARKAFHRSSAAEVFLEQQQQAQQQQAQQQQQAACDDADMANDDADGSAYGAACGAGGGFGAGPRLARESWFQPKWVPGPLFAVRDVLGAFPATQPASEHENPALVRAEADPRFDLEDLRALSYDEYVETASGETREQIRDKYIGTGLTEERRRELGLIAESELSHTVAVQASRPVGSAARFLAFKMAALESELAIVREGGREFIEQNDAPPSQPQPPEPSNNNNSNNNTEAGTGRRGEETERPGRRRAKGRETKQARSYQRITSILKDESYFGPTEPASTVEMMSAARAKLVYQDPSPDVVADARLAALFDRQHVPDLVGEKDNEIVLRVTFYSKRFAKDQEYLVLGSQPLVVLRDAISCAVDGMMIASERQQRSLAAAAASAGAQKDPHPGVPPSGGNAAAAAAATGTAPAETGASADAAPATSTPTTTTTTTTEGGKQHGEPGKTGARGRGQAAFFKSASFLIENVFYNDTRDAANADYSAPILEWAEERRKDLRIKCPEEDALLSAQHSVLGPYRVEDMARVRFDQLLVRIGSVYAFLHQADCEHRFMISDVRLLGPGEDHDRSNYPLLLTRSRITRSRCDICAALVASQVTCNDAQAPCSPCHWCQHCYDAFHYNADGTPTYTDFQVLPYVYDTK